MSAVVAGRRSNREGTISSYRLAGGELRYRIAYWVPGVKPSDDEVRKFKKGFATEEHARNALAGILVDIRRGEHLEVTRDTLGGYAAEYFDTIRVRASTLAGYKKHWRVHVEPSKLAQMKLSEITKADLNRFYRRLEASGRKDRGHVGEGLSAATVRHIHTLLSQIFAAAVDDELIRFNPAKKATPPTKTEAAPPEMQTWSDEEARTFLNWTKGRGDSFWLAWYVLLSTGLRRGELLALRWRDIDEGNQSLHVARSLSYVKEAGIKPVTTFTKPKSGKGRNVTLSSDVVEAFKSKRTEMALIDPSFAKPDSLIFHNRFGNNHNPVQFSRQWRVRVAEAREVFPGLPKIKVHELRHTHATLLLRAGVHPKIVSERLGHASVTITLETYSHAVQSLQRDAATMIGSMLG